MRSAAEKPRGTFVPPEQMELYLVNGWTLVDGLNPHQVLMLPPSSRRAASKQEARDGRETPPPETLAGALGRARVDQQDCEQIERRDSQNEEEGQDVIRRSARAADRPQTTALVRYEAARRALAEAKTVDEVKDIIDRGEAMRVYGRQSRDRTLENDAKEIRWRATRRLGEMIKAQKATIGLADGGDAQRTRFRKGTESPPTLAEIGIDKKLSSRAQKYADLDGDSFERLVARCRAFAEQEEEAMPLDLLRHEKKEARRSAEQAAYAERTTVGCTVTDLDLLASSGARFGTIYADPPWEFKAYSGKGKNRSADRHYNTGGLDAIKALPVQRLAADDCALLIWCVMPELLGALEVIRAWGFEYKTVGFTWVKQNKSGEGLVWGMGYWTRANAELCLLATRGSPNRIARDVHQVVLAPVAEHSRKPDEVHDRIERLIRGPYLELYARRDRPGWTTWGNEIPRAAFAAQPAPPPTPRNDCGNFDVGSAFPTKTASPLESDDIDLPTFLRRGHPDCTLGGAVRK
jgi:N6-adenosine-specific RNA methylase IME4